jgi:hypothetical protein
MDFSITLVGTAPLLVHNSRLSDPLDPFAKAIAKISGKRKKTEDDHVEMGHINFLGALYYDSKVGPHIPADNIQRSLLDAARITRSGPKVNQGVFIHSGTYPLEYDGPRDAEKLWADENFRYRKSIKVQTQRVMRVRPKFPQWSVTACGSVDTNILDFEELRDIANTAGTRIGLGDWRPRWGRYTAELKAL